MCKSPFLSPSLLVFYVYLKYLISILNIDDCVMKIHAPIIKNSLLKMAEMIANPDKYYTNEEKAINRYY